MRTEFVAVTVFTHHIPGLDVCPPVQQDLDGLKVTSPSSPVKCGAFILSKKEQQRATEVHGIGKLKTNMYIN